MSDSLRGRWVVLCDGDVVASFPVDRDAYSIAVHHSLGDEFRDVASVRVGWPTTFRRFENGDEVLP